MSYTGNDRFLHHLEMSEQALERAREELSELSGTTANPTTNPTNPDGQPRYDDSATDLIERHIANDEPLLELVREIITRAYEDDELARHADPQYIGAPRADAADAIREYFDEQNPLYEEPTIYLSLIDFALDRCDFGEIVDYQRRRMAENAAAEKADQERESARHSDDGGLLVRPPTATL